MTERTAEDKNVVPPSPRIPDLTQISDNDRKRIIAPEFQFLVDDLIHHSRKTTDFMKECSDLETAVLVLKRLVEDTDPVPLAAIVGQYDIPQALLVAIPDTTFNKLLEVGVWQYANFFHTDGNLVVINDQIRGAVKILHRNIERAETKRYLGKEYGTTYNIE